MTSLKVGLQCDKLKIFGMSSYELFPKADEVGVTLLIS